MLNKLLFYRIANPDRLLKICRGYLFVYSGAIIKQLTINSPLNVQAFGVAFFLLAVGRAKNPTRNQKRKQSNGLFFRFGSPLSVGEHKWAGPFCFAKCFLPICRLPIVFSFVLCYNDGVKSVKDMKHAASPLTAVRQKSVFQNRGHFAYCRPKGVII